MSPVNILNIILVILVFVIAGLVLLYFYIGYRNKNKTKEEIKIAEKKGKSSDYTSSVQANLTRESIFKFMEFDEIKDNMIIRKGRTQYVMVVQCQGVNYDLLSEKEKIAVEEGFVQFLNTLRFQIQLYVQTRSLNLKDIIEGYRDRVKEIQKDVEQIRAKIREVSDSGNLQLLEKLRFEERRKVNILEYGADVSEYIARMSLNKNVLQQKTYVIISYYSSELGNVSNYSKEEIDNMCFSELYTRTQSIIKSLASCEVSGRILNSEELAELLYVAYNRDDSELLQISKALDAQYDALYSTSKDVLEKKKAMLDKEMEEKAVEIATKSLVTADEKLEQEKKMKEKRKKQLEKKAIELIDEYKDDMSKELYDATIEEVKKEVNKDENIPDEKVEEPKKRRGRKKNSEK